MMATIGGVRVIVSDLVRPVPKLQVSPLFKWIGDECRRDMDAFLLDTFGTKDVIYMMGGTAVVSRAQYEALRRAADAEPSQERTT